MYVLLMFLVVYIFSDTFGEIFIKIIVDVHVGMWNDIAGLC